MAKFFGVCWLLAAGTAAIQIPAISVGPEGVSQPTHQGSALGVPLKDEADTIGLSFVTLVHQELDISSLQKGNYIRSYFKVKHQNLLLCT